MMETLNKEQLPAKVIIYKTPEIKRAKLKRYYVYQSYTAAAAARKAGVTEKTAGIWIKANGWKALRAAIAERRLLENSEPVGRPEVIIEDLMAYIEENTPMMANKIRPIVNDYLKTIS